MCLCHSQIAGIEVLPRLPQSFLLAQSADIKPHRPARLPVAELDVAIPPDHVIVTPVISDPSQDNRNLTRIRRNWPLHFRTNPNGLGNRPGQNVQRETRIHGATGKQHVPVPKFLRPEHTFHPELGSARPELRCPTSHCQPRGMIELRRQARTLGGGGREGSPFRLDPQGPQPLVHQQL